MKCGKCGAFDRVVKDQDDKVVLCPVHLLEKVREETEDRLGTAHAVARRFAREMEEEFFNAR